jgi:hypothetical protein
LLHLLGALLLHLLSPLLLRLLGALLLHLLFALLLGLQGPLLLQLLLLGPGPGQSRRKRCQWPVLARLDLRRLDLLVRRRAGWRCEWRSNSPHL